MKTYEKIGILLYQSHCSIVPKNTALLFPNLLHFILPKSLYFFFLFTAVDAASGWCSVPRTEHSEGRGVFALVVRGRIKRLVVYSRVGKNPACLRPTG